MPRSPGEKVLQAEKLYNDGMAMVEIAKKFEVSDSTVRSWKNRYGWGTKSKKDKCNVAEIEKKKSATLQKKRRGAPLGNQNAKGSKGGGAPPRNQNAKKHGAHVQLYLDSLTEEELKLFDAVPVGEEYHLQEQISVYTLRERKLMHEIKEFKKRSKNGLYAKGVKKKKHAVFNEEGKAVSEYEDTITDTENVVKGIIALESELTKVQRAKTNSINSLIRLRAINDRYDDLLNGWKTKAEAKSEGHVDNSEEMEEVQIYIPHNGRDEI